MDFSFQFSYSPETKDLTLQYAKQADLTSFDFSKYDIETLCVLGDYIDHLIIPDGVKWVSANRLGLKTVSIPDSVKIIYLNNNFLTKIDLPGNIEQVYAKRNYLISVTFRNPPSKLTCLDLQENRLSHLDFEIPKSIEVFRLRKNFFSSISTDMQRVLNSLDDSCL